LLSNSSDNPHRHRAWVNQSYLLGSASMYHHLIHSSLVPHESAPQTASRSVTAIFVRLTCVTNTQTDRQTHRPCYVETSVEIASI